MADYYTLEVLPDLSVRAYYESWRSHHEGDSGVDILCPYEIQCHVVSDDGIQSDKGIQSDNNGANIIKLYGFVVHMVGMKIRCRMLDPNGKPCSYYLYPRSSISKTPLSLANSVGIIDAGYRGEIKTALRHTPTVMVDRYLKGFSLNDATMVPIIIKNERLVQICAPNLGPIRVRIVDSLDSTDRGEGGFGSTSVSTI